MIFSVENFEQHARKLVEPNLPIGTRLQMVMAVKDNLGITHSAEYFNFLKCYICAFSAILLQIVKPQLSDNQEHKLRNEVVEILKRIPHNEVIRPFVPELMKVTMHVLMTDNEENGVICIQIIFDLLRGFSPSLEDEVQPFLEFACRIYQNFGDTVSYFFESDSLAAPPLTSASMSNSTLSEDFGPMKIDQMLTKGHIGAGHISPSTRSFKIVTESSLELLFLFQSYSRLIHTNIPNLLPLMVSAISVLGPKKVPNHLKSHFIELKCAQVKTLSFLTYLLKGFTNYMQQHEERICKSIVNLLVTCPDSLSIRRELLLALKNLLSTDFKRGLFSLADTLLDQRVLVGTGQACFEALRPLAYNIFAEISFCIRGDLSMSQLYRLVHLFSSNIHDGSLSPSIHTSCARQILNLLEPILKKGVDWSSMDESRLLLAQILDAFVGKFNMLKHIIPQLLDEQESGKIHLAMKSKLEILVQVPVDHSKEVSDYKQLIRTLVKGVKIILWSITRAHQPRAQFSPSMHGTPSQTRDFAVLGSSAPPPVDGMREDEILIASAILKSGVPCLAFFKEKDEEREMIHIFSKTLAIMEPRDLKDMFSLCMAEQFDCMISSTQLVHIFSNLLEAPRIFCPYADVWINFLVSTKLDVLNHPDSPSAKLVLHLFRMLFSALAKAPSDCERIVQPHVPVIMESCMQNAIEVTKPIGYLQLLHTMFQGLCWSKFEQLLQGTLPLLLPCLDILLDMLEGSSDKDIKELLLKLCLTLPRRLCSVLPYLPRLMKPLVMSLQANDELVSLGLETLEFWIDNLDPQFLEISMANVMSELNLALWSHIRPAPYSWGSKSSQILGKLGGRNRRFLKEPLELECKENPDYGLCFNFTFEPSTTVFVPLDRFITVAVAAVTNKNGCIDMSYRRQALKFLRACLASQLNFPGIVLDEQATSTLLSTILTSSVDPSWGRSEAAERKADLKVKTKTKFMSEKSVFKVLLMTIISASADPELHAPQDEYVVNVCRHFAILFYLECPSTTSLGCSSHPSNCNVFSKTRSSASHNLDELDPLTFLDALVDVLADENRLHADAGLHALNVFVETLLFLCVPKGSEILMSRGSPTPMTGSDPSVSHAYSSPPSVRSLPVFELLLRRLLHSCYGLTWQIQMGGVLGLGALIGKVTIDSLSLFQLQIVQGLVYVLKRLPTYCSKEQEETSQVLTQLLRAVNNITDVKNEAHGQHLDGVVEYLASELFNVNTCKSVKRIVQYCLTFLASRTGSGISELLEPLYEPLFLPLVMQQLRFKTVKQQIGTVTALNFCLALRPPILKWTPKVVTIIQEALQIADAEDIVFISKFGSPKVVALRNKLQTACIEVLCTAMACADFKINNHSELHAKIVSMLFKSLTSRTPGIIAVAKESLRQVIQKQSMHKELLQISLRPILFNVAQIKYLSMPFLQGLARLLELLSNWIDVNLGEELLQHLKLFLEPEKLGQCQRSWKPGEESKIAAVIIELFHLLPATAGIFLDDLVTLTIGLEAALPPGQVYSEINSPYRLPLTKFLNRYPEAAVDYFLARLTHPKFYRRFMYIVQSDAGQSIREELSRSPEKLIATAFPDYAPKSNTSTAQGPHSPLASVADYKACASKPENSLLVPNDHADSSDDAYFHGLAIVKTLVKLMPSWLQSNHVVFDTLVLLWKAPERISRLQHEQDLTLVQVKESKWLVKCFLNYLRRDKNEHDVLFDILSIFLYRTRLDFTFLKEFYIIEVAEGYPPHLKKTLLLHFMYLFQSKLLQQDYLVVMLQMLILPMLLHSFQNGKTAEVVDNAIIKIIVDKIIDPPEEISSKYDEPLRIALLQFATLLLKYVQHDLVLHRDLLLKFGWIHLMREGSACKLWAYIYICHFLKAFQAPEKFFLQVFGALLRDCQPENKMLVNQGLDILMPELSRRLPHRDSHLPTWIHYMKMILEEETHSMLNVIHIYQLIVRHADLFYCFRSQFVHHMVNSLSRIGFPFSTSTGNTLLAIEFAGLIVNWEKQRQNGRSLYNSYGNEQNSDGQGHTGSNPKHPMHGSTFLDDQKKLMKLDSAFQSFGVTSPTGRSYIDNIDTSGSFGQTNEEYKPNAAMREMIINFLIKVALVIDPRDNESMYNQALDFISQALDVWPNAYVKFNYLEKLHGNVPPTQLKFTRGLNVMNKVIEKQPYLFIQNNITYIPGILELCFKYKTLDGGESLSIFLKIVAAAFPIDVDTSSHDVKILLDKVKELVQKHLASIVIPHPSVSGDENSASMLYFVLHTLKTLVDIDESFVDSSGLVSVLQRLACDIGSSTVPYIRKGQKSDTESIFASSLQGVDVRVVSASLKSLMMLVGKRIMLIPDGKRSIIQIISFLLSEKGTDPFILLCILDVIKGWIEDDYSTLGMPAGSSTFISPKNVVYFCQKLSQVDKQRFTPNAIEDWDGKYLEMLYGLCSDCDKYPSSLCQEVFQKVERRFLLGLRAKDPTMRMNFLNFHNESLGKTLFIRLQYIIEIQDWEAVSDVFWLKQGIDLLLAILVEDKPITLAPNSAKLPPIMVLGPIRDILRPQIMVDDESSSLEETPLTLETLVSRHAKFLNNSSKLQVSDLVMPLRELAHTDANIAYNLWVLVFPIVWETLSKEEQEQLAKGMIRLLSKKYHENQQMHRPNVVQALLGGLQLSYPHPKMPSELITSIGKTYNAWYISMDLLESHAILFEKDAKCYESLSELYHLLNEGDMRCGLWKNKSIMTETRDGLSLVQHGYWQHAQCRFYQAIVKATQGSCNLVPQAEMRLWEEQWLHCATQLGQWDALVEFAKEVGSSELLLGSLWEQPGLYLKANVIPSAQVEETPNLRIFLAYILHDKKSDGASDVEKIVEKTVDLGLQQWWKLPEMCVNARIPLLQQFQQQTEFQESNRVLVDIYNGSKLPGNSAVSAHNKYAYVKDIFETWRLRMPNKWDNLSVWYDILNWRNVVYNVIIEAFEDLASNNSRLYHLGYHDKASNVNKLARIARKQGNYDVCVSILEKLYEHSTMEFQDVFVKVTEQAKACLEMTGELINGLNLINSTNLECIPVKQQAEIFHLKGDFLLKLNDSDGANLSYSKAISLYKNLPKGWISWGNYCDVAYKDSNEEIWLEYAAHCFLQGIKFGIPNSRSHLVHVLYLLSFDTPSKSVGRALDKYLDQIPHWVWLCSIPQLLLSLQRTEGPHCKPVLLKIASVYPQALYYCLSTYLHERLDAANKSEFRRSPMEHSIQQDATDRIVTGSMEFTDRTVGATGQSGVPLVFQDQLHSNTWTAGPVGSNDAGSSQTQGPERTSAVEGNILQNALRNNSALSLVASAAGGYDAAKDIMETLRSRHSNMASELEIFVREIGSRFVTFPEERLLSGVNALLHQSYNCPTATTSEVPPSLKKGLSALCRDFFSADSLSEHGDFVREYKQDFERDLDPESGTAAFPGNLSELTERLKHWKYVLQSNVEDRFPAILKLEDESKVLRDFHFVNIEVPGQYFSDQEIAPDHTVKLDRVSADIQIVRRHGCSFRRMTLIGSDGSQHCFIVQTFPTPNARSDERMLHLFRVMNQMFGKHKESRSRHICIHTPIIIPVSSEVRLVEDDLMYSTFLEVYENYCERNDREVDQPITFFKEQLNPVMSCQILPGAGLELRLQTYEKITKTLVTGNIFSEYMYKTLVNRNHMWVFKKQFAIQVALSSFVSYMLQIGGRSPDKILFAKNTGNIFQTEFHPSFNQNGMIECNEPLPFRFTGILQTFFSPFGVEGLVVTAMCAAAQAVVSPKKSQHLWHHLAMLFRDELLSWESRISEMPLLPTATGDFMNSADLKQKVTTNVELVIGRLNKMPPQQMPEEEENAVDPSQYVQRGVAELVEAALSPKNLCMMDPTWHPWF